MAQSLLSPDDMMMSYQQDNTNLLGMPLDVGSRGNILPVGRVGGVKVPAIPQGIFDMYRGFTAPSRAYRGKMTNPMEEAFNLASNLTGQGIIANIPARMAAQRTGQTMLGSAGGVSSVSGGQIRPPETDELGFYSQALETARNLMQPKGTGEQYRQMLLKGGVKPDEIRFTPELEGLLSQPKITRDELVGLLEANRIRPQETVLTANDSASAYNDMNFSDQSVLSLREAHDPSFIDEMVDDIAYSDIEEIVAQLADEGYIESKEAGEKIVSAVLGGNTLDEAGLGGADLANIREKALEIYDADVYQQNPQMMAYDDATGYTIRGSSTDGFDIYNQSGEMVNTDYIGSYNEAVVQARADAYDTGMLRPEGDTNFSEFTEDGGTNYREMLLQIPEYAGKTDDFVYSGHFEQPNIAVHARTTDRNSDTGVNDVLYAEEIQSDWGQRGRKYGFDNPKDKAKLNELIKKAEPIQKKLDDAVDEKDNFVVDFYNDVAEKIGGKKLTREQLGYGTFYPPIKSPSGDTLLSEYEIASIFRGVDQVALTADGKEFPIDPSDFDGKDIITKFADLDFRIRSARDELDSARGDFQANVPEAPLVANSDKFAEAAVKRLINQAAKEGKRYVSFSPSEVQLDRWGEEGLETFYEKILPKAVKKVSKKLDKDAMVDYMPIEGVDDLGGNFGTNRLTIEITPKMREEALRGQPLFSGGLPVPASGLLGQEENNNRKIPAGLLDA